MLAVVVVLFLAFGVSDGMNLTKCDLKKQLETGLTLQIPNSADVLAQIVCHVQKTSGFNTSTTKTISEPKEPQGSHDARHGKSVRAKKPKADSTSIESVENKTEVCTLYGLFQLSDQVVCSSNQSTALNLCRLSCDKLIDGDISDDIACVQTLINALTAQIPDPNVVRHIKEMVSLIRHPECLNTKASSYFANCH